jgi:hypothetical protein
MGRIFENQHLLDATEIFRKLNVHKKVSYYPPAVHSNIALFYASCKILAHARITC